MATPNEITTLLASQLEKELDVPFKLMLMERVKYWRSRLIRNSIDKNPKEREHFWQEIIVPLTESNSIPCGTNMDGCPVAISSSIPKPLRASNILFDYVGSIDGSTPFKKSNAAMVPAMMNGKYSKKNIYYDYTNTKIKVFGNSKLPKALIIGIFDNPEDAYNLHCSNTSTTCDYWNMDFPVSGDVLQLIVQSILQIDYNRVPPVHASVPVAATQQQ